MVKKNQLFYRAYIIEKKMTAKWKKIYNEEKPKPQMLN
jgi:hypothetical protein